MDQSNRTLWLVLIGVALVLLIGSPLIGGMMGFGWMGPGMMGWGYAGQAGVATGWMWVLGTLMMVVFWGAIIIGVALFVRWATGRGPGSPGSRDTEDPLAILSRRYAAGEIDQSTYEQMKAALSEAGGKQHEAVDADKPVGAGR
jgi:putative membrane protein